HRAPARRAGAGAALPARAGGPDHDRPDRSEPGVRPHAAMAGGRRGIPGDGRTPRNQGNAQELTHPPEAPAESTRKRQPEAAARSATGAIRRALPHIASRTRKLPRTRNLPRTQPALNTAGRARASAHLPHIRARDDNTCAAHNKNPLHRCAHDGTQVTPRPKQVWPNHLTESGVHPWQRSYSSTASGSTPTGAPSPPSTRPPRRCSPKWAPPTEAMWTPPWPPHAARSRVPRGGR